MVNLEKPADVASGILFKLVTLFDSGASTTITILRGIQSYQQLITIQLAMSGATTKSTHVSMKMYYVYDRTGTLLPTTTKAYYVKELNQDLLGA
jgi:hypothetical protein